MLSRRLSLIALGTTLVVFPGGRLASEDAQWELNGDLESSTGNPPLVPLAASPAVDPEVTFETAEINGQTADVAHFSRGTYFDVPHGLPPNGGGVYLNQYTLIMDVMFPDRSPSGGLASLLQTNCCNQNDGDWFVGDDGLGTLGTFGGSVPEGEWHRLALVVDLAVGTMTSYVDGAAVQETTGQDLDGRFSLYAPDDGDPDPYETFFIFADESEQNAEGFVNSVQFHDLALSASVIAEIGGPSAGGIPRDVCVFPAAVATRDIATFRTARETNADFLPGDVMDVEITLSNIRKAVAPCTAPSGVVIVETLPAGWAPSQVSDGGVENAALHTITWTISGAAFTEGKKVRYKVTAAASPGLAVTFAGTLAEDKPGAKMGPVQGESRLLTEVPFDACGGIRSWNVLGCFTQPANNWPDGLPGSGDNPGVDHMRLDFMTDGSVSETEFIWYPGAQIATAFGGAAASVGLQSGSSGRNPNGVPEVLAWNDRDSFINLNDDVYGGDPNVAMAYLQAYVNNPGPAREVIVNSDSDDSILVILNGEEVWANSVPRGSGLCQFRDVSPDGGNYPGPITLEPGENNLIVKVFEGGGGFNAQVRFEDPSTLEPVTDLGISKSPQGLCLTAPLLARRDIAAAGSVKIQHGTFAKWDENATYDVSIAVSDIRGAGAGCAAASAARIEETLPDGWTPSSPSPGGVISGQTIAWDLSGLGGGGPFDPLTYKAKAPAGPKGPATFRGKVTEGASPIRFVVVGESTLQNPSPLTSSPRCFITNWLLLGPYKQPGVFGANPGVANIRRDHLCDGASANQVDIEPKEGDVVNTTYSPGGCARSTGLVQGLGGVPINPGDKPTWYAWRDEDDTIHFNDYYGGDLNQILMHALAYVDVAEDIAVDIGLDSDDSVQVLLDGAEIWVNNIARAQAGSNAVVDVISSATEASLNPLTKGRHKILVKVFEGGGEHNFRLRFQDPSTGEGICEGISICLDPNPAGCGTRPPEVCSGGVDEDGDGLADCLDPDCAGAPECQGERFQRGDADGNKKLELTDAIRVLGFLFLGQAEPACKDADDADDNGRLELTDAIRILNYLFLGTGSIPPPNECGLDTSDDALDCASYPPCNA